MRYLVLIVVSLFTAPLPAWAQVWGEVKNLGEEVNSYLDEGDATVYEGMLYFSARDHMGGSGDWDIFYIDPSTEGWMMAEELAGVNTPYLDASPSFDGWADVLYFHSNRPDGLGSEDIYFSRRVKGKWQKPQNLGEPINTPGVEAAPCISEDGEMLFFCCDREGGFGGLDIWVSLRTEGGWSEPLNLGSRINTAYNEKFPFFTHNLLMWSSNVLLQAGDYDIFYSHLTDEGWEKAQRLPDFISSSSPEWGAFFDAEENLLYFTSVRMEGYGGYDIYSVTWEVSTSPPSFDRIKAILYRD